MSSKVNANGLRLLATLKVLNDHADPSSPIGSGDLRRLVAERQGLLSGEKPDTEADRRTLYQDIETLRCAGYSIDKERGTRGRYSMEPTFETWELRFITDAIRTSRSLTKEQGSRLVEKVKSLASIRARESLDRRFIVQGLFHNGTFKQTAYALDAIENALDLGCKLSFKLVEYLPDGTTRIRKDRWTGKSERIATPIEYVYSSDGFYYLIILDPTSPSGVKTPRIDRMTDIEVLSNTPAEAIGAEQKERILEMFRRSFGMFETVRPVTVGLTLCDSLIKNVMDRFGDEICLSPAGDGRTSAVIITNLSDNFYSWIAQFAGKIIIDSPKEARSGMADFLQRNAKPYTGD